MKYLCNVLIICILGFSLSALSAKKPTPEQAKKYCKIHKLKKETAQQCVKRLLSL